MVVRYGEIQQNAKVDRQADQDRRELRQNRQDINDQMTQVLRSNHETYGQLGSLQSQQAFLFKGLEQVIVKNDPRQVRELTDKAHSLQQQTDKAQQELLALTMAPQTADQLRDWKGGRDFKQQDLHNFAYEEEMHYQWDHPKESPSPRSFRKWSRNGNKRTKMRIKITRSS
jgi:hypothetical protein